MEFIRRINIFEKHSSCCLYDRHWAGWSGDSSKTGLSKFIESLLQLSKQIDDGNIDHISFGCETKVKRPHTPSPGSVSCSSLTRFGHLPRPHRRPSQNQDNKTQMVCCLLEGRLVVSIFFVVGLNLTFVRELCEALGNQFINKYSPHIKDLQPHFDSMVRSPWKKLSVDVEYSILSQFLEFDSVVESIITSVPSPTPTSDIPSPRSDTLSQKSDSYSGKSDLTSPLSHTLSSPLSHANLDVQEKKFTINLNI